MVVNILGRGYIEIHDEDFDHKVFREALSMMENLTDHFSVTAFDVDFGTINFEMGGNKIIDYSPLDKIKKILVDSGMHVQINVTEFVEGESNYYFDNTQ